MNTLGVVTMVHTFKTTENYNYSRVKDIVRAVVMAKSFNQIVLGKNVPRGEGCGILNKGKPDERIFVNGIGSDKSEAITFDLKGSNDSVTTNGKKYDIVIAAIIAIAQADGHLSDAKSNLIDADSYTPSGICVEDSQVEDMHSIAKSLNIDLEPAVVDLINVNENEDSVVTDESNINKVKGTDATIEDLRSELIKVDGVSMASKNIIIHDIINAMGIPSDKIKSKLDELNKEPEERLCLLYEKYYEAEVIYDLLADEYRISEEPSDYNLTR